MSTKKCERKERTNTFSIFLPSQANNWCRRGVELLGIPAIDLIAAGCSNNPAVTEHAMNRLEQFLGEGDSLKVGNFFVNFKSFAKWQKNITKF